METADVGALSLTSPVWFLSAVIYGILTAGAQPRCTMELRVIHKNNSFMLRIRDNSHIFDPIKKMSSIASINDPSRYIGIKMVMKMATEVVYTSTLKLNNLVVRIDKPDDRKTPEPDPND